MNKNEGILVLALLLTQCNRTLSQQTVKPITRYAYPALSMLDLLELFNEQDLCEVLQPYCTKGHIIKANPYAGIVTIQLNGAATQIMAISELMGSPKGKVDIEAPIVDQGAYKVGDIDPNDNKRVIITPEYAKACNINAQGLSDNTKCPICDKINCIDLHKETFYYGTQIISSDVVSSNVISSEDITLSDTINTLNQSRYVSLQVSVKAYP